MNAESDEAKRDEANGDEVDSGDEHSGDIQEDETHTVTKMRDVIVSGSADDVKAAIIAIKKHLEAEPDTSHKRGVKLSRKPPRVKREGSNSSLGKEAKQGGRPRSGSGKKLVTKRRTSEDSKEVS